MINCETCINNRKNSCKTMNRKPKELFCYMTRKEAVQAENDIIKYAVTERAKHEVGTVTYQSLGLLIRRAKAAIRELGGE